jgi:GTP diphosphokinase / guanosine-3',5'-bis(diphosphate) 3'-diphosphatase
MLRQYELVERVKAYDPDADEAVLNRAYVYTVQKHGTQKRASGDPYFSHPIEVAGLMTELKLDLETIVTALLHDTVEDTLATIDEVESYFGPEIARLVDGVTKLSKIETLTESERAAENLRKFFLAMSEDLRVLLVKLADRLHNMRTLHFIKSEDKRRRIARETMDIYAPLAERVGMYEYMREMQLLAFEQLEPEAYATITGRLAQIRSQEGSQVGSLGAREAPLFDLEEDGRASRHLRADHGHHGLPRADRKRGGLLQGAGRAAHDLADDTRPVQGLHLHAQVQRLPLAPHGADL